MNLETLFNDKALKPKEKTEIISKWLLDGSLSADELVDFARKAKDPVKATCIEAFEYASKTNSAVVNENTLEFVSQTLNEKAPRIKWESAKVIGHVAHLFPSQLDQAIEGLLQNTSHEGTVVRWSAAYALGEIVKLPLPKQNQLVGQLNEISEKEEKNSIRRIYQAAIKKIK